MTEQDCFVSHASFWEIAIKADPGKLPGVIDRYLAIVSPDAIFDVYGIKRIW